MKLIYCPVCDDVFRLIDGEWRQCQCGRSGGQYTPDSVTAVIGGIGKVFGLPNPLFREAYMSPPEKIAALRAKYNNLWTTEMWWGEFDGDTQLLRVKNPRGPVPSNWEDRLSKLCKAGGVKGYDPVYEGKMRDRLRAKAVLRAVWDDLSGRIWKFGARGGK